MKRQLPYLFVAGMFRSGTTLLCKSLNAHPNITVASDPYFEFFRAVRNEVYRKNNPEFDDDKEPLSDNFFSKNRISIKEIRDANFDRKIELQKLTNVKEALVKRGSPFSGKLMPFVEQVSADNYKDFFIKLMNLVKDVYGNENTKVVGIKEVWCEEFISPLINTFPDTKCIHIIRDPRAVVASNKKRGTGRYPMLFLIRHWRKSCEFVAQNQYKTKNYLAIKYEDLIDDPQKVLTEACRFLGVAYSADMCDGTKFVDGDGKIWKQNSSYGTSTTISKTFLDKWQTVLSEREIQFVEDLCEFEMEKFGYKRLTKPNITYSCLNPPPVSRHEYAEWIMKYSSPYEMNSDNLTRELLRYYALNGDLSHKKDSDKQLFDLLFVSYSVTRK